MQKSFNTVGSISRPLISWNCCAIHTRRDLADRLESETNKQKKNLCRLKHTDIISCKSTHTKAQRRFGTGKKAQRGCLRVAW